MQGLLVKAGKDVVRQHERFVGAVVLYGERRQATNLPVFLAAVIDQAIDTRSGRVAGRHIDV